MPNQATTVRTPDTLPEAPRRVLVAEDEHLVAMELIRCLSMQGLTTIGPVGNGDALVALAETGGPDLAIVDVNMPGRDGLSGAKELYERFAIPVIVISAYSDEEFIRRAQDAGVFAYLVKPASDDQIRAAIALAWTRYRDLLTSRTEADELRRRLAERRVIESAKWLLVSKRKLTEPEAMKALQKHARDSRRSLSDVAQSIVDAEALLEPRDDSAS